jgi:hypothetical protein
LNDTLVVAMLFPSCSILILGVLDESKNQSVGGGDWLVQSCTMLTNGEAQAAVGMFQSEAVAKGSYSRNGDFIWTWEPHELPKCAAVHVFGAIHPAAFPAVVVQGRIGRTTLVSPS